MDERNWTDRPLTNTDVIKRDGATVGLAPAPVAAYLISGDITAGLRALCPDAAVLGVFDNNKGHENYAIRIGRHSVLLVLETPISRPLGWTSENFGISDASDLYVVFDVHGDAAEQVLAEGGVVVQGATSASAAIQFAGITALIVRDGKTYRIWIPRAYQTYISTFLGRQSSQSQT